MATDLKSKNWRFSRTNFLCRTAFLKLIAISQFRFQKIKWMNLFALCTILVTFGPVTPEFTLLTIKAGFQRNASNATWKSVFAAIWLKSAYHAKYLRISWTYLHLLYRFGSRIPGDDYPDICLAVAQGTLLWQPVKFGKCSHTSPETIVTLWSGVWQRIRRSWSRFQKIKWE